MNVQPAGVLVIWQWEWKFNSTAEHEDDSSSDHSSDHSDMEKVNSSPTSESDHGSVAEEDMTIPHTVTFKVIGCTKERVYQDILKKVRDIREEGQDIPIALVREPCNPFDCNAIAFQCKIDGKWKRVGYVVSEILSEVHTAIENSEILRVEFAWVKYISDWTRSGPGFFAGVKVTKKGQWSSRVVQAASTR